MRADSRRTSPLKTHSWTGKLAGHLSGSAGGPVPPAAGPPLSGSRWWLLKTRWPPARPPLPLLPRPPVKMPPGAAAASSSPGASRSPSSLPGLWSLRSERSFSPVIAGGGAPPGGLAAAGGSMRSEPRRRVPSRRHPPPARSRSTARQRRHLGRMLPRETRGEGETSRAPREGVKRRWGLGFDTASRPARMGGPGGAEPHRGG